MPKITVPSHLPFLDAPKLAQAGSSSRWGDGRHLAALVRDAKKITCLTGAGLSATSGIHTYRGSDGVWTTSHPVYLHEFESSRNARLLQWQRTIADEDAFRATTPNRGHEIIDELRVAGATLITQNIDSLHTIAARGAGDVIELHGNNSRAKCLRCGGVEALSLRIRARVQEGKPPLCTECNYIMKPDFVMFGERLDYTKLKAARTAILASDLIIVVGTSLQVHPAAGLIDLVSETQSALAILVDCVTPYHGTAELTIAGDCVDALILMQAVLRGDPAFDTISRD